MLGGAGGLFRLDRLAMRIAAALCALAAAAAFVPSMIFPFVSLFAFDQPGSESTIGPYLLLVVLWSMPAALAGSVWCAVVCVMRPRWRWLGAAVASLAIPAAIAAVFFDPLHWRHHPPAQEVRADRGWYAAREVGVSYSACWGDQTLMQAVNVPPAGFHGPVKRSITIAGHETSVSLEPIFWAALERAAAVRALPLSALVAEIDALRIARPRPPNLASALRTWLFVEAGAA